MKKISRVEITVITTEDNGKVDQYKAVSPTVEMALEKLGSIERKIKKTAGDVAQDMLDDDEMTRGDDFYHAEKDNNN